MTMENESVGDFFKQVRETKGLTVDDVASKTRIHPDFLKALEEGNFAKLPDQVFAKGFVRSYARSLGLDEEDAMRRFAESAGLFYNKQSELDRLRVRQLEDERRKQANRKVVIAAAAVAVLGLVLLLNREQSAVAPSRQAVEPQASTKVPPPAGKPVGNTGPSGSRTSQDNSSVTRGQERADHAQPAGVAENHPAPATSEPSAGSAPKPAEPVPLASSSVEPLGGLPSDVRGAQEASLVLDLEAVEVSWVVVQADGASPHEALLRPGERMRWTAAERFMLTLGNAGGVRVELNGKPQGPFGPSGKVARDILLKR